MSKPILYKANETNFSHLGLGVLADEVGTPVVEERNGQFYLEMKYPINGKCFKELKNDRLIKVSASHNLKDQRFKIIRISKPAKGIVTVYAEHVSYHTADLPLKPNVEYSGSAQSALNIWSNNLVDDHPFTVYSDIPTTASGTWETGEVENARQALGGVRGSILDMYGGEYRFDNYHIGLYQNRGDDNGLLIAYGKNLTDLEQEEEIANTYTSIMPYAYHQPEGADEPQEITLPEYFVDSEHVDKYARRKILKVNFTEDEITNVNELRARTKRYIEDNDIGVPKVNLRVKYVDLAKTLDYKDLAKAEEINLCDWVTVYFEKLDIKVKAKVIKTTWNPTLERYDEIEIGETKASLSQSINDTVDGRLEYVDQRINRVQIAANGKNKVFRGPEEPKVGMSVNDLWYKPVGDGETELYRFTGAIWELEKVSAGLLGGTLDAENGDVDLINVNASSITTGRLSSVILENTGIATFTDVDDKINDVELGIRNLLKGTSSDYKEMNPGSYYSAVTGGDKKSLSEYGLSSGDDVVFRMYLSPRYRYGGRARITYWFSSDNMDYLAVTGNLIAGYKEGYSTVHLKIPSGVVAIQFGMQNENAGGESVAVRYKEEKAEHGTKPSRWTPAPEDNPTKQDLRTDSQTIIHGGNIQTGIIEDARGTTTLDLANGQLIVRHNDGSQTRMDANGLNHREGGTNYETSYLNDVFTITGLNRQTSNPYWYQLPSIYRGKKFRAVAAISDAYGSTADNSYFNLAMLRIVTFVDQGKIDYANARVPLVGYSFHRDIRNDWTGRRQIQVQLFVSY